MKKLVSISLLALLPVAAFAQSSSDPSLGNLKTLAQSIGEIVNIIIPIMFAIALLGFFWGLVKYIFGGDHDKEKAKKTMLWGIVALFLMAAVWGLVNFLGKAVGITPGTTAPPVSPLIPKS